MKANKFFAVALAALTLVGFNACKDKTNTPDELTLDQTSLTLAPEATATLTANVEATWTTSNAAVATVAGNGKTAVVTAVAEGNAIISATANGVTKTCVVLVKKGGTDPTGSYEVKGTQFWPVIMDGITLKANESKMVASFQPNDVDQFLYVWDETYDGVSATGMNAAGNTEGYTAMVVSDDSKWVTTGNDWSGAGFCLTADGEGWKAAESLRAAVVANPDDYFVHIALKSTDNYSQCFYIFGSEDTKFIIGSKAIYSSNNIITDYTRDGSWHEFDIPLSSFATALASTTVAAGVNVFVILTEGVPSAQLNIDEVYFYKK